MRTLNLKELFGLARELESFSKSCFASLKINIPPCAQMARRDGRARCES